VNEIHSYRRVFELERRLYRIDRVRLNPSGIPVRGVLYALAGIVGAVLVARLPLLGRLVTLVPWYLRDVAGPIASAALLASLRVDGRAFHHTFMALIRLRVRRARLGVPRSSAIPRRPWSPGDMVLLPDGSDARLRRLRYTGPGVVVVRVGHRWTEGPTRGPWRRARSALSLAEAADAGGGGSRSALFLDAGSALQVRGGR
jgi:hypothetical protein